MYRLIFVTILALCLTACSHQETMYECRQTVYYDTEDLSAIVWDFVVEMSHERGLFPKNAQVIAGPRGTKLRFDFTSQDIIEMCPARELLVDVAENILERVNMAGFGSQIQPYPFTADQLEIYIDFESFYGVYCDPTYIGWIVLEEGMSYFYDFEVKDRSQDYWRARREPYAKSLSFVRLKREAEARYRKTHPGEEHHYFDDDRFRPLSETSKIHQF